MLTYACTKTVGYSYTEQAHLSFWSHQPMVRMREIRCQMQVGERRVSNAGVSRSMRGRVGSSVMTFGIIVE